MSTSNYLVEYPEAPDGSTPAGTIHTDVDKQRALRGCWLMRRRFDLQWVSISGGHWSRRLTPDTLWLTGSGLLINRTLSTFRQGMTPEGLCADEPNLKPLWFGWGFINADDGMDNMAHRYMSYHISPRLHRYFDHCESFSYHLFAKTPQIPQWLDAEHLPDEKAIIVYGVEAAQDAMLQSNGRCA